PRSRCSLVDRIAGLLCTGCAAMHGRHDQKLEINPDRYRRSERPQTAFGSIEAVLVTVPNRVWRNERALKRPLVQRIRLVERHFPHAASAESSKEWTLPNRAKSRASRRRA